MFTSAEVTKEATVGGVDVEISENELNKND